MKELVPLLQTLLWITCILALVIVLRREISLLRQEIMRRIEKGVAIKIGVVEIGELKEEVNAVKREVNEISDQAADLFLLTMSSPMYFNLEKLALGDFGAYEMTQGLRRELYHLRDIGYIDVDSITAIPPSGTSLSKYVKVTPAGRQFVSLRKAVEEKRQTGASEATDVEDSRKPHNTVGRADG